MSDGPQAPAEQTPVYEKGLILPAHSLPCVPVSTGVPQNECNHHGSTVAELADGTVAALWYHGEEEKALDSRLVWSRYAVGASGWTAPEVVFDDPGLSEGNAAIWVHEDGTIYVFFVTIYGGGWDATQIRLMKSSNGGASWSAPETLREEYCWNVRHRPLRLSDGQLLLPLYQECLALPTFIRSSDDFDTWSEDSEPSLTNHIGQIQPALIGPPRLGAAGGGDPIYGITRDGTLTSRIHRMQSDDAGLTWSASEPIGLPNSGTSVDWVRLANDHVVVVFNDHPDRRFPLSVALSLDDGDSFVAVRDINAECAGSDCSYSYPSIMQSSSDGSLWVTYTHDRETIGYVRFNEAWLAEGTEPTAIGCAATETCSEGVCLRGCETADECRRGEVCEQQFCRLPCDGGNRCEAGVCAPVSISRCDIEP